LKVKKKFIHQIFEGGAKRGDKERPWGVLGSAETVGLTQAEASPTCIHDTCLVLERQKVHKRQNRIIDTVSTLENFV